MHARCLDDGSDEKMQQDPVRSAAAWMTKTACDLAALFSVWSNLHQSWCLPYILFAINRCYE